MAVDLPSSEADIQALLESAVSSRASHIRRESQTITMAKVRRLLESDMGLENSALDIHKAYIRQLVDEVLLSSDNVEAHEEEKEEEEEQKSVSEEVPKKTSGSKRLKKSSGKKAREENGSVEEDDEEEGKQQKTVTEEVSKKTSGSKRLKKSSGKKAREENGSVEDSEDLQEEDVHGESPKKEQQKEKKRRASIKEEDENGGSNAEMSEEEVHVEAPKKKQRKEREEEEISHSKEVDEDGSGSHALMSEEDSDVSEVKKAKKVSPKIASSKPTQNKKIEHLKKIIKACGLTIPPQIYKRAKQQPEDKQDKFLIKEFEDFLSRRGLSSNPSDKEIKAAKQKIAREKDLEGIDTTNIILEPRGRRATSQLFAPVYNPPPVEYDSEGDEEESEDDVEGSEEEGKDFAAAEDPEDSD